MGEPALECVDLLGIGVSRFGMSAALDACRQRIASRDGGYACFVNTHSLSESKTDDGLARALSGATFCFADGVPLVWLSRLHRLPIGGRVCGPDFMTALMEAESANVHGFIGGIPGRAEQVASRFGIEAVTYSPPMRGYSEDAALEDWREFTKRCPSGEAPPIVWVALGAPKQELWLSTVSRSAPSVLFFGVGAAIDFLSGGIPRAPRWMQPLGLEWVHRLATNPRRLWKRYLVGNTRFLVHSARELIARRAPT